VWSANQGDRTQGCRMKKQDGGPRNVISDRALVSGLKPQKKGGNGRGGKVVSPRPGAREKEKKIVNNGTSARSGDSSSSNGGGWRSWSSEPDRCPMLPTRLDVPGGHLRYHLMEEVGRLRNGWE